MAMSQHQMSESAGIPMNHSANADWRPLVERIEELPQGWMNEIGNVMRRITNTYHPKIGQEIEGFTRTTRSAFNMSLRRLAPTVDSGYFRLPDIPSALLRSNTEDSFEEVLDSVMADDTVDLREYDDAVRFLWAMFQFPGASAAFLRVVHRRGLLHPAPTIYWRVNRTIGQCSARAQVNLDGLFRALAEEKRNQLFVEFGQGGGRCMEDRREWIHDNRCTDIGYSDRIYYQIDELLDRVIDYDALDRDGAAFDPDTRKFFCRYAYKVIVIESGKTDQDDVAYDAQVFRRLKENPESFTDILREKLPLLSTTDEVPDDVGIPDPDRGGAIVHRGRDRKPADPAFLRACELLASKPDDYIRCGQDKTSVYALMEVNPCGAVSGKFSEVTRLKNEQIDLSLGIRSTQYLEGDDYGAFMTAMTEKLSENGFYIDDNVRTNYGLEYRLAALLKVQQTTGFPIHIVHGTGPDGEYDVPVSVIMTRSQKRLEKARTHLYPGAKISPVETLANDETYCRTILERSRQAPEQLASAAKR